MILYCRLEKSSVEDTESNEAIRNLVLLVASLSFCNHKELPVPTSTADNSLYQLESFRMPKPENKGESITFVTVNPISNSVFSGSTVRNPQAFQVLQSVFLKSQSEQLSSVVLDAVSTIYNADNANYFLLEDQHTLSQFCERIHLKPAKSQEKLFQLLEFVVHHLKHVPFKELIAVSLFLKAHTNEPCCVVAVQSLINIVRFDPVFKDVFREVGE